MGALFLTFLSWLLFAPIMLHASSYTGSYYLGIGSAFRVFPSLCEDRLLISVKLPFYQFHFDPLKQGKLKEKKSPKKAATKKGKPHLLKAFDMRTIKDLMHSFRINRCVVDVDTNDYVLNAKLIPVFYAISRGPFDFRTNFNGNANFHLEVENRLYRVVGPLLKQLVRNIF